jgi:hypothetical protein
MEERRLSAPVAVIDLFPGGAAADKGETKRYPVPAGFGFYVGYKVNFLVQTVDNTADWLMRLPQAQKILSAVPGLLDGFFVNPEFLSHVITPRIIYPAEYCMADGAERQKVFPFGPERPRLAGFRPTRKDTLAAMS